MKEKQTYSSVKWHFIIESTQTQKDAISTVCRVQWLTAVNVNGLKMWFCPLNTCASIGPSAPLILN